MIKEIKVYSRFVMDEFIKNKGYGFPYDSWDLVSIYNEEDGELATHENSDILRGFGCERILSLSFWDVTEKHTELLPKEHSLILFSDKQSKEVIYFIDNINKDKEDSILVVHCAAGVSRSGAIAAFVSDYCGLNYNDLLRENKSIMPNPYVLRTLRRKANMIPFFE